MSGVALPKTAILELTYECGHRCKFCSCPWEYAESPRLAFEKRKELSINEWKEALHILEKNGVEIVGISGGEPTLKEGLGELLRYIRSDTRLNAERDITLISNAQTMNGSFIELFKETDVHISFSLPGLSTFAYHTGAEGNSAENVLYWLGRAKEAALATTANVTVTKKNIHELHETLANALIAGAETLLLNRFLVGGRGASHQDELALSKSELTHMVNIAEEVLRAAGKMGSVGTEIPQCLIPNQSEDNRHLLVGSLCAAAKADGFFVIDPSGYIRACNHSPKRLGYIFDKELITDTDYWNLFANREYQTPDMCVGCADVSRCDCGCREAASICYGSISAPDPCMAAEN
jgi:radical SAM protein with 4Fe4S-binding SPASM domain